MRRISLLLLSVLTCGCGTLATVGQNKSHPVQTFSGSMLDLRVPFGHGMFIFDLPCSIIADCIVLPYTIPATVCNLLIPRERRVDAGFLGDEEELTRPTTRPTSQPCE